MTAFMRACGGCGFLMCMKHLRDMKNSIILFLLSLLVLPAAAQVKIVDACDGSPVTAASVYLADGRCAGVSSVGGVLPLPAGYDGTVTVQHINYKAKTFATDTVTGMTVRLEPCVYSIPEVTARYERPDYMVISVYARGYAMGDSVPASFMDGLYDYYVPMGKGRIRRKVIGERRLYRSDLYGDDTDKGLYVMVPQRLNRKRLLINRDEAAGYDAVDGDTVFSRGRRGDVTGVRLLADRRQMEVYKDSMFASDDYTISLFGFRARLTNLSRREVYDVSNGSPALENLLKMYVYDCIYWRVHGKSKPEIRVDRFNELYVTGMSYVSKAEMKAALSDKKRVEVAVPAGVPPLNSSLAAAVGAMR